MEKKTAVDLALEEIQQIWLESAEKAARDVLDWLAKFQEQTALKKGDN